MKQKKDNSINFEGQPFYIGVDVHKKSWKVTVRSQGLELETFSMYPSSKGLNNHLARRYKGGQYYSVYEAGFCGFHIHKKLTNLGITNIVINPADVPTTIKEKQNKSDKIDSRKLARELENGSLKCIYIPTEFQIELRSLSRLRYYLVKDQTRLKNRIKSYLYFNGVDNLATEKYWSANYINRLKEVEFEYDLGKEYLLHLIASLEDTRKRIAQVMGQLRKASEKYNFNNLLMRLVKSVPGVGMTTAINLYTEIMDMTRFRDIAKLASYVGLVPSIQSSGDKEYTTGITRRSSKYLRFLLIEAAWLAIKKDEALFLYYSKLLSRMNNKRAIVSVARKLLSRIRHVWLSGEDYVIGLVK